MNNRLIERYIWLIQCFIRAGADGMDLKEVQKRWSERWGETYTRRSFCNHRDHIREIFGINIGCRRSDNIYMIDNASDADANLTPLKWLVDSLSMRNLAELAQGPLKGRIAFEELPSGNDSLQQLVAAMEENRRVRIEYRKYSSSESSFYTLRPYAVKEYAKRWYLVAYCEEKDDIRVYALDRLRKLEAGEGGFSLPEGFDVDELFADCFGIYLPDRDSQRQTVVFKASAEEVPYLDDLPLHPSQTKLSRHRDGSCTYSIKVHPNRRLLMEFLSRGSAIEVCKPLSLRKMIQEEITKTKAIYE